MLNSIQVYKKHFEDSKTVRFDAVFEVVSKYHANDDKARDYANSLLDAVRSVNDLPIAGKALKELLPWTVGASGQFIKAKRQEVAIIGDTNALKDRVNKVLDDIYDVNMRENTQSFNEVKRLDSFKNQAKRLINDLSEKAGHSKEEALKLARQAFDSGVTQS